MPSRAFTPALVARKQKQLLQPPSILAARFVYGVFACSAACDDVIYRAVWRRGASRGACYVGAIVAEAPLRGPDIQADYPGYVLTDRIGTMTVLTARYLLQFALWRP